MHKLHVIYVVVKYVGMDRKDTRILRNVNHLLNRLRMTSKYNSFFVLLGWLNFILKEWLTIIRGANPYCQNINQKWCNLG